MIKIYFYLTMSKWDFSLLMMVLHYNAILCSKILMRAIISNVHVGCRFPIPA